MSLDINKSNRIIKKVLSKKEFSTTIKIFMSTRTQSDYFDKYESNYSYTNLNPIIIKGIVTQLTPTSLVWRDYGLKEQGSKEIICEKRWKTAFEKCNKIEIDNDTYEVFKESSGNRAIITERRLSLIRVVVTKNK